MTCKLCGQTGNHYCGGAPSLSGGTVSTPTPPVAPPIEAREWLQERITAVQSIIKVVVSCAVLRDGMWCSQCGDRLGALLDAYYAACRATNDALIAEERRKERAGIMTALRIICEADSWGAALGAAIEGEPEMAELIQKVRAACRAKEK